MTTERSGQAFGRQAWKKGLSVQDTVDAAGRECGIEVLPEDPVKWPRFVHGAEEAWQDCNLAWLDEQQKIEQLAGKHTKKPAG